MSLVGKPMVIGSDSTDVLATFERWLTAESASGIRFVILEGAMRSGKIQPNQKVYRSGRPAIDKRRGRSLRGAGMSADDP
jgi:hypothetical protein